MGGVVGVGDTWWCRMISAAFQYAGLGVLLGMLLVTAVVVLVERPNHDLDADDLDRRLPSRGPSCSHPHITSHRTDFER